MKDIEYEVQYDDLESLKTTDLMEAKLAFLRIFKIQYLNTFVFHYTDESVRHESLVLIDTVNDKVILDYDNLLNFKIKGYFKTLQFYDMCSIIILSSDDVYGSLRQEVGTVEKYHTNNYLGVIQEDIKNGDDGDNQKEIGNIFQMRAMHGECKGNLLHYHRYDSTFRFDELLKFNKNSVDYFMHRTLELQAIRLERMNIHRIRLGMKRINVVNIIDVKGLSLGLLRKPKYLKLLKRILNIYCLSPIIGNMQEVRMINLSSSFKIIWKVIKTFIPKENIEHVHMVENLETLRETIDLEHIPLEYGGSCSCDTNKCYEKSYAY